MRLLAPIILIIISVASFFTYVDPTYQEIKEIHIEEAQYDEALERSRELQMIRDELLSRYNTFRTEDLRRLDKMLPDNVDNVRLILEINEIASNYGMTLRSVAFSDTSKASSGEIEVVDDRYDAISLSFSVSTTYENFLRFLGDLEGNLRIVDIEKIDFSSGDVDLSEYDVSIRTYWLE